MARDRERWDRMHARAVAALFKGNLTEAQRLYRAMGSPLGLATTAVHQGAWERAARKGLAYLAYADEVAGSDDEGTPEDEAMALRIVELALERMAAEPAPEGVRRRREALVAKAKARLAKADWPSVRRHVRRLADAAPEIWGPLALPRVGRRLAREALAGAADLLLEVDHHAAQSAVAMLGRRDAAYAREFPICLHCFDEVASHGPEGAQGYRQQMRAARRAAAARYAADPEGREHALLLGTEALHLAEILGGGRESVDDLLVRADALLAAAPGMQPAGTMENADEGLLASCVGYHRARVAELRRDLEGAVPLLEDAAARDAEPWSGRAVEALVRVRGMRDAEAHRRRVADLRARWARARDAGDAAEELRALGELVALVEEDGLWERLALLAIGAGAPGWTERASEAVRRGSRDAAILAALTEEAVRRSGDRPKEAVALFRLALRGGPLDREVTGVFADALLAFGRAAEAGKAYEGLAAEAPLRHLDAARAYSAAGETKRVLASVEAILGSEVPRKAVREAYRIAADVTSADALRPIAEKALLRDPDHREAAALLKRLSQRDFRLQAEAAARAREGGLAAAAKRAWREAAERLASVPEAFRDPEARLALARALEETGRPEEALAPYGRLAPARAVLEGRARCLARLRRFEEARLPVGTLVDLLEGGVPALGDDPDLLGLLAEARGEIREAAGRYEDEGLLAAVTGRARESGDAIAEYTALQRLADRHPARAAAVRPRIAELDAVVPVRAKGRYARDLPTLVLCDTNVLLAELLEDASTPDVLHDLRRPSAAARLAALRADAGVRLAVTRTIARETRAVLRYRVAVQEDEEAADAVRAVLARAEAAVGGLAVERVAGVAPRTGPGDLARVRAFYASFPGRVRRITRRKVARAPERAADIRRRRARAEASWTELPEGPDVALVAEAAWLAGAPVTGVGGVGIASDDADFRAFRAEIERAFGVRVV